MFTKVVAGNTINLEEILSCKWIACIVFQYECLSQRLCLSKSRSFNRLLFSGVPLYWWKYEFQTSETFWINCSLVSWRTFCCRARLFFDWKNYLEVCFLLHCRDFVLLDIVLGTIFHCFRCSGKYNRVL